MELRHLRYFVAVARESNFTRAAAALGIQQPPLSQQIRDLERELGFDLFRRLPRGVALTPGGAVFQQEAEAILDSVEHAVGRARRAASGTEGTLSIGFTSSAMSHRLAPEIIRRFREEHPAVELVIQEGNAEQVSERVASGQLDLGFIRRAVSERSGLEYTQVIEEPLMIALPRRHPVAQRAAKQKKPSIRLAELAGEPFILVRRPGAPGMYGDLLRACHKAGFAPNVVAEVSQMLTNITLVAAGVGVSAVPASMRDIHAGGVLYVESRDLPRLKAPINLVTRLGHGNPVVERFVAFALKLSR
jgi:DNA-binding transcriptional LysR family regulator